MSRNNTPNKLKMKNVITLCIIFISCLFSTIIVAQPTPPGGGGTSAPPQNPKPINGDDRNGGEDPECITWTEDYIINFFIESSIPAINNPTNQFALPNGMPPVRLAIFDATGENLNQPLSNFTLIYLSEEVSTFNQTGFYCSNNIVTDFLRYLDDGQITEEEIEIYFNSDHIYYNSFLVPGDLISEYAEAVHCKNVIHSTNIDLLYAFVDASGAVIEYYPISSYPSHFDCLDFGTEIQAPWLNSTAFILEHTLNCQPIGDCDYDNDGIPDGEDNCPYDYNPEQDPSACNSEIGNGSEGNEKDQGDDKSDGGSDGGGEGESSGRSLIQEQNRTLAYPNPFTEQIQLAGNIVSYNIYDSRGAKVVTERTSGNMVVTSEWETGLYILHLFDGTNWITQKLIKI